MELPDAVDAVRPSILQVAVRSSMTQRRPARLGTGFLIDDGFALTARHVTREAQKYGPDAELLAGIAQPNLESDAVTISGNFQWRQCRLIGEDPHWDLSLVQVEMQGGRPHVLFVQSGETLSALLGVAHLDPSRPRDGEAIAVSGYPLNVPSLVTTSGGVACSWATNGYLADLSVNPGNSGGPAYRISDARVIGTCVAFEPVSLATADGGYTQQFVYNSGLAVIIPIGHGTELLQRHRNP